MPRGHEGESHVCSTSSFPLTPPGQLVIPIMPLWWAIFLMLVNIVFSGFGTCSSHVCVCVSVCVTCFYAYLSDENCNTGPLDLDLGLLEALPRS
jgi:hypothetical protein